jgi:hypothetical protein
MRPLLEQVCSDAAHAPAVASARRREGARFMQALLSSSIDLGDEQVFSATGTIGERNASRLIDLLLSTL